MRYGAMAAACAVYAAVILYPFEWTAPRWIDNAAEAIPGGWRFAGPGIVRGPAPAGDIDLRLRAKPARLDQHGPARILTISHDTSLRNLLLGQDGRDLIVRVRSHKSTKNGTPAHTIKHVFQAGRWADIRFTLKGRALEVYIDGRLRLADTYQQPPVETWNRSYELALGNEHDGDRPWLGEIEYDGKLHRPPGFWVLQHVPRLIPFREVEKKDVVLNFLGFVPFGVVLLLAGWSLRIVLWTTLGLSLLIEVAQLALVGRFASVTDVVLNTLGALAGALIARRLVAARAATDPSEPA